MKGIEKIIENGNMLAIIIRNDFYSEGYNFFSDEKFPMQLGVNFYKKGSLVKPHIHLKRKIEINEIQEIFRVEKGGIRAILYTEEGKKLCSVDLNEGDIIFFISGGHGFEILDDTKLLEIKQGPYLGKENDKKMIDE